jgi:hypothetical protein
VKNVVARRAGSTDATVTGKGMGAAMATSVAGAKDAAAETAGAGPNSGTGQEILAAKTD